MVSGDRVPGVHHLVSVGSEGRVCVSSQEVGLYGAG